MVHRLALAPLLWDSWGALSDSDVVGGPVHALFWLVAMVLPLGDTSTLEED